MSSNPEQSVAFLLGRLANEQEARRKLQALLSRAADALEDSLPMKQYASQFKLPYFDLIAELRKAAE